MPAPAAPPDWVRDRLARAGCVAADIEAAELLAAGPDEATLETWVRRREAGEPLPWIVGSVVFCDARLRIDPGVYVPRQQSEELARRAAAHLPAAGWALDLCSGAGAVAAALRAAVPSATVIAVDLDPRAARCTLRNGVAAFVGDLAAAVRPGPRFDVITAVAPYVPTDQLRLLPADVQHHEPRRALDGGDDGLEIVRRVILAASSLLVPGGWLLTEVGGEQDAPVAPALAAAGFDRVEPWWDEHGDLRGVACRRSRSHRRPGGSPVSLG